MSKDASSSFRTILGSLINRIDQGEFAAGSFLPTERELKQEFGCARTTVRRALAALVEAGYGDSVPNRGVRVRTAPVNKSNTIAFIDGSTLVLRSVFRQLSRSLVDMGYGLLHIDSEFMGLKNAVTYAIEHKCAAAFVWPFEGFPDAGFLTSVRDALPIVALDHRLRGFETDLVTFDYFQMGKEATQALIAQGCKRIAVTGMFDMLEITHERFNGYLNALFEAGLAPNAADFVFTTTSEQEEPDGRHLATLFNGADRPDGLLVLQDQFAAFSLEVLQSCGLSFPSQVKVATIGDDLIVSVGGKRINAVHCDWNNFSNLALELMMARLRDPQGPIRVESANYRFTPSDISSVNRSSTLGKDVPYIAEQRAPVL